MYFEGIREFSEDVPDKAGMSHLVTNDITKRLQVKDNCY